MTERRTALPFRAYYLGTRLDLRSLADSRSVAWSPLVLHVREGAWAVLFRYGAVVLVGMDPAQEQAFLATLTPHVARPYDEPQVEALDAVVDPARDEAIDQTGTLWLKEVTPGHLQVVAEVLAKSAALAHYEGEVGAVFTEVEPLMDGVRHRRRRRVGQGRILAQLQHALSTQARIMGRVEVTEKPEVTWDDARLDRLYVRLATEYELAERDAVLARKTDFISQSAHLLIGMAEHRQTLRVEWYIVILIVVEIVLLVFDLSTR